MCTSPRCRCIVAGYRLTCPKGFWSALAEAMRREKDGAPQNENSGARSKLGGRCGHGDSRAAKPIRRTRADDEICILARPAVADLFTGQPFADRILTYDYRGRHAGWLGREKLDRRIAQGKFRRRRAAAKCLRCRVAGLARGHSRAHRIRARWTQRRCSRNAVARAARRRDPKPRIALLSGIASHAQAGSRRCRRYRRFAC